MADWICRSLITVTVQNPCGCVSTTTHSPVHGAHSIYEEYSIMMQMLVLQRSQDCTSAWLSASIDDNISRLFLHSSTIAKLTPTDGYARAELRCPLPMHEAYDIRHVLEKTSQAGGRADNRLIERMGRANTSRRQFIAYSRTHRSSLESPIVIRADMDNLNDQHQAKQPSSPAHGILEKADYDLNDMSDPVHTTTVATTLGDWGAFEGLRVPSLSYYASSDGLFVCPLCQCVEQFYTQSAWR